MPVITVERKIWCFSRTSRVEETRRKRVKNEYIKWTWDEVKEIAAYPYMLSISLVSRDYYKKDFKSSWTVEKLFGKWSDFKGQQKAAPDGKDQYMDSLSICFIGALLGRGDCIYGQKRAVAKRKVRHAQSTAGNPEYATDHTIHGDNECPKELLHRSWSLLS